VRKLILSLEPDEQSHKGHLLLSYNIKEEEVSFGIDSRFIKRTDTMRLYISKDKTIGDIQEDFNTSYPFLKLEFYKRQKGHYEIGARKPLSSAIRLEVAGMKEDDAELDIKDEMTVADLEETFRDKYGLSVQVSRKSGIFWLETTMTDNWSLQKQNEHGKEISFSKVD
jgi:hypothetical protein